MTMWTKCFKHLKIITRHKIEVFKACWKCGLYWQAFTHDLSKYCPQEFFGYAKYYTDGTRSPVDEAKERTGRCDAWLHHRGRNKHHYEYWIENLDNGGEPLIIPMKYAIEMICDYIGAGKAYNPGKWTFAETRKYWQKKRKTAKIHPAMVRFFDCVFDDLAKHGYFVLGICDYFKLMYDSSIIWWKEKLIMDSKMATDDNKINLKEKIYYE